MSAGNAVSPTRRLNQSNPPSGIGYLGTKTGDIIDQMATNRVWAWNLTPGGKLFVHERYPVHLLQTRAEAVIQAAHAVLLGVGTKAFGQGPVVAVASVVSNLSLALSQRAFGVRVVIYDSQLTYRPGFYHIALSDGAYSATPGANLGEIYVRSATAPIEVMMFGIQNTGGQASIIGMATPTVTLVASDSATVAATATTTTVGMSAETLNERDLSH